MSKRGGCGKSYGISQLRGNNSGLICGIKDGHCPACAEAYRVLRDAVQARVDEYSQSGRTSAGTGSEVLTALAAIKRREGG